MYETSDTIVICRPNQVEEAAVVLSCCQAGRFTPLIVMEPPPVSEREYWNLYEAYRDARNRRDQLTGTTLARQQTLVDSALDALDAEVDAKTERLTPYRSWLKHNEFISRWLSRVSPRRAVFLFEPEGEDLRLIKAVPADDIGDSQTAVIPEDAEWIYFLHGEAPTEATAGVRRYYKDLGCLAELSWAALHGSAFPKRAIEIAADDLSAFFTGLYRSLETSAPLRPIAARVPPLAGPVTTPGANEAIVIEISKDANKLLGVLYAHIRRAKPVFYVEPDLGPIEAARIAIERTQNDSAGDLRYVAAHRTSGLQLASLSEAETATLKLLAPAVAIAVAPFEPKRFLDALARLLGREDVLPYIQRLEQAVSAAVPDTVLAEVGDLDVTAFTTGTPYNFVRKNGVDWSDKTVGHIVGDSSLLVLEDLLPEENAGFGFNLIFDPGYFTTSETRDVLSELQRRVSYSLVLSGLAASSISLSHLSTTLPVELLFFNTHGADNAILLRDMLLPAFKVVQRVTLRSRPIVFNNSCLSWVGVGREFIRSGARAYIGTLWSVDAAEAAGFARTVIRRTTKENIPVACAMHGTGVDPLTERSYIFVGPSRTRMVAEDSNRSECDGLFGAASLLFHSASSWLNEAGGDVQAPYVGPLVEILVREAEWITGELDRKRQEPSLERLDLFIQQLGLSADLPLGDSAAQRRVADILRRGESMLDLPGLDENTKAQRRTRWMHLVSRVYARTGQFLLAVQYLNASIESAEKSGESQGPQYLELSDALKAIGRYEEALAAAERASEAFPAPGGKLIKQGRLGALGRLAQVSIRLGRYEAALQYTRDGFNAAVSLDDLHEQAVFMGDQTRALRHLNRVDEALATAYEMLSLARQAHDDRLEISAYGTLANVLMQKGQWSEALERINVGLAQAQAKGIFDEVGDFLGNLATIKTQAGDDLGALSCWRQAGLVYVRMGQLVKLKVVLETANRLCRTLRTWPARSEILRLDTGVMDGSDRSLRREVCMDAVSCLKEAIQDAGIEESRMPLRILHKEISDAVDQRGASASEQLIFVNRALGMFDDWASGRKAEARREAEILDSVSMGGFKLVDFMER